jgi:hypothetical protein
VERLPVQEEELLGQKEMAGGGNGNEFRDSLDDAEDDCREPGGHKYKNRRQESLENTGTTAAFGKGKGS